MDYLGNTPLHYAVELSILYLRCLAQRFALRLCMCSFNSLFEMREVRGGGVAPCGEGSAAFNSLFEMRQCLPSTCG